MVLDTEINFKLKLKLINRALFLHQNRYKNLHTVAR